MAVSNHQNERPAINALIDASNTQESELIEQSGQIGTLTESLNSEIEARVEEGQTLSQAIADETNARESDVAALESSISAEETARANAITGVMQLIGNNFTAQHSVSDFETSADTEIGVLNAFMAQVTNLLKFGVEDGPITVAANNYYDGTVTYESAYPENSNSFVFAAFLSDVDQRDLELTVSECTNAGFSYTVVNRNNASAEFAIGYLALGFETEA